MPDPMRMIRYVKATGLISILVAIGIVAAPRPGLAEQVMETDLHRVKVSMLTEGLEHPWGLAFLPDGRMLVTERPGRLRLVRANGRLDPKPVTGLPPIAPVV